jgi:hypothetical protein
VWARGHARDGESRRHTSTRACGEGCARVCVGVEGRNLWLDKVAAQRGVWLGCGAPSCGSAAARRAAGGAGGSSYRTDELAPVGGPTEACRGRAPRARPPRRPRAATRAKHTHCQPLRRAAASGMALLPTRHLAGTVNAHRLDPASEPMLRGDPRCGDAPWSSAAPERPGAATSPLRRRRHLPSPWSCPFVQRRAAVRGRPAQRRRPASDPATRGTAKPHAARLRPARSAAARAGRPPPAACPHAAACARHGVEASQVRPAVGR